MSRPPIDPKLPLPPTGDDPSARLFYPGSYFDRLVRRLGELLMNLSSQREDVPTVVAGAVDIGGATANKVVALNINGTTYYFLASSTPPP